MNPISMPVVPAQPDQAIYGLDQLQLFKTYTRESYFAAFGVQAPNFDASRPEKYWFDSSADPLKPAIYNVFKFAGIVATVDQLQLDPKVAESVNIPGLVSYSKYVVDPTPASIAGASINPVGLSSKDQAVALAAELGLSASSVVDNSFTGSPFAVQYNGDTRRMWAIVYNGAPVLVGLLLQLKYAQGIGHPGTWSLTPGQPTWTPAPDPPDGITSGVPSGITPVPVRALLPNEQIISTLMAAEIARTDMASGTTGAATADGYGPQDRATLTQILTILKKLNIA